MAAPADGGIPSHPSDGTASMTAPFEWANWPMPNPAATTLPNPQGYSTIGAAHVSDKVTHLEWQRFTEDKSYAWSDALYYCKGLMVDGLGGWRLPSRIELISLVDFTIATPAIDAQTFAGTPPDSFWSATPFVGAKSAAWGVHFGFHDGLVFTDDVSQQHRVRCVR